VLSCDGNAGRVRGQVMFIYVCVCVGNLYTRMYVCVCVLSLSLARSLSLSLYLTTNSPKEILLLRKQHKEKTERKSGIQAMKNGRIYRTYGTLSSR